MSDIAIRVEHLGKRYRIGKRERYRTIRESVTDAFAAPFRWLRGSQSANGDGAPDFIWALKDLSFEVKRGKIVGIIGQNGAGKSTLLKVLSRITEPTEGHAEIRGRVGSLLEVGTGFHPELTGRENIYLNGAILGMKRAQINRRFDEIVAFAEVEKFLDTPVKRYSSGMYVRLAFAVAAHMESEILLIDEVLAVGDLSFQEKCLGRIGSLATHGRTVLFVSHNMAAVSNLCSYVFLLAGGSVAASGPPTEVLSQYIRLSSSLTGVPLLDRHDRKGDGRIRFTHMEVSQNDTITSTVSSGRDIAIQLHYESSEILGGNIAFSIAIYTVYGQVLLCLDSDLVGKRFDQIGRHGTAICRVANFPLSPGSYNVNIFCQVNGVIADWIQQAARLTVVEGDFFGTGRLPPPTHGGLLLKHDWELEHNQIGRSSYSRTG